jgi:hypothetical protein
MEWTEKRQLLEDLFIHRRDAIAVHRNNHWMGRAKSWTKTVNGRNEIEEYQPYAPENGDAILYHHAEEGSERVGVYPHALDNSTIVIVGDFDDKQKTNEELFATCLSLKQALCLNGIPAYIERSHSGFGFHVWTFFEKPIDCELATKVMVEAFKQVGLPMTFGVNGYDRLFPCVTKVGRSKSDIKPWVGNIIGLPLQAAAAANGNCVFLDDSGTAIEDQWALLKNIQKVSIKKVIHFTKDTVHVQPKASKESVSKETSGWEYWKALSHVPHQMDRMKECEAIKEHIVRPNNFDNRQWALGIMGNLAVFTSNDDLQDEVIKFAYDIEENFIAITGAADTTEQTLMARKDNLQMGEYPMSCKKMFDAGSGWKCPKLETCPYNFIAKYNAPPSFTIYSTEKQLTVKERVELNQLEQLGLYEAYCSLFVDARHMTDYRILAHLLAIREYIIQMTVNAYKSICYIFADENQAIQLSSYLKTRDIPHDHSGKQIWMLRNTSTSLNDLSSAFERITEQAEVELNGKSLKDQIIWEDHKRIAPFFGSLSSFVKYAGLGAVKNVK